jgi:hypothetical protein
MGSGDQLGPEFVATVLTVITPLVGFGALWALVRPCLSGLLTQPSLAELEKTCASAVARLPSDWQKLKSLRSFLCWLTLSICIVVLFCLVLWVWVQVVAPVPKAADGVTLAPSSAQVFACAAIVFLAALVLLPNFLWEARMRVHKEQIEKLRKS